MSKRPTGAGKRSGGGIATVASLVEAMRRIAPIELAEPWDNVGLIMGDPERPLNGPVMLTIDLSEAVAVEAVKESCSAVVAYHPPIFRPIKRLACGSSLDRALMTLLSAGSGGVAVYSPHTALDAAHEGLTDWLADGLLGLGEKGLASQGAGRAGTHAGADRRALRAFARRSETQEVKIVTFVPPEAAERVRSGLAAAGAGLIGNYELCSFTSGGHGSFVGREGSKPTVGRPGKLELVPEIRLEMVCSKRALALALEMIRQFHPYEEPAVDVYELLPKPDRTEGAGRRIAFDHPVALSELARRLSRHTGGSPVMIAPRESEQRADPSSIMIRRAACVPGAGGELAEAALENECELFVTGEMKHHEIRAAVAAGMSVLLGGHTQTERGYLKILAKRLESELASEGHAAGSGGSRQAISVIVSKQDVPPTMLLDVE